MTIYLGDFAAGSVIYVPFHTFNAAGGSVTITGLAVTDIEIYKNGSTTQRASDAGYTLLDTDGIDFDGLTGIHGFSVNTGDNTDSGFYSSGADYWIVVSAITVDSQTVSFVAATFSIENRCALRPTTAGRTLDITSGGNAGIDLDNIALTNGCGPFGIQASGTLSGTHSATTADLGTNAPATDIAGMTLTIPSRGFARFITSYNTGTGVATFDSTSASLTNGDQWYLIATPTVSSSLPIASNVVQANGVAVTSSSGRMEVNTTHAAGTAWNSGAITASTLASDTITAAKVASDVTTEIQSGLATASSISTLTGYVDTEVAAIKAVTDKLDTALELDGAVYRYTTNALENGPSGGGGTADWTADERTAIRSILGIPGSGTTPADPSAGILDTIRDAVAGVQSDTNDIQTRLPAALVSGRIDASVGAMAANVMTAAAAAADLTTELQSGLATSTALATVDAIVDTLVSGVITGAAATGTLSTTQATSDLTGYANDQLIGRVIIWLSGNCAGEASTIEDYASAGGLLTFTALTTAPANGDTFKIV